MRGNRGRALCLHTQIGLGQLTVRALWPDVRGPEDSGCLVQACVAQKPPFPPPLFKGQLKRGDWNRRQPPEQYLS
jgi:hypothetical protein